MAVQISDSLAASVLQALDGQTDGLTVEEIAALLGDEHRAGMYEAGSMPSVRVQLLRKVQDALSHLAALDLVHSERKVTAQTSYIVWLEGKE